MYGAREKSHILVNHHLLQPVNGWLLPMKIGGELVRWNATRFGTLFFVPTEFLGQTRQVPSLDGV